MSGQSLLLLLSIGPVQSFIAQARKLKDLRSGSQLLSQLTKAACDAFEAESGKVIVPGDPTSKGLPNRMLGTVEAADADAAVAIARKLEGTVRARWQAIVNEASVVSHLSDRQTSPGWEQRFKQQIDQALECYWAVEPYAGLADYPRAYEAIEATLGAVKNARVFHQIGSPHPDDGFDESSRKDALTGERDALVFGFKKEPRDKYPANVDPEVPRRLRNLDAMAGPNEGLSAVSAVKRFRELGEKGSRERSNSYLSTADIALLGIVRELKTRQVVTGEALLEMMRFTSNGGDGQLAFPENLTLAYFESQGIDNIERVREKHDRFQELKRKHDLQQTSYYAVLAFDGDSLGSWLSGDKLVRKSDGEELRRFHSAIGQRLADFARAAERIVDDGGYGITVYAGGDDYLGAISLDGLFPVLKALRLKFRALVSDAIHADFEVEPGKAGERQEFTFSAGLVVAHYKRPLGDTVQLALAAEKFAKDAGRDRLCIRVVKRSGEQQQTTLPWGIKSAKSATDELDVEGLEHLRNLVAGLQGPASRTWLTESARTLGRLFGDGDITPDRKEMARAEIWRLIARSLDFSKAATEEKASAREEAEQALAYFMDTHTNARDLVHTFHIVDFLKRQLNTLEPALESNGA